MIKRLSFGAERGFTLVELLVVIGIIGILAGVMMANFSGGTETARAAKCLSNMRNLAQGAISYAAQRGHYPYAGSHAAIGVTSAGKTKYTEHVGWISWLSMNDEYNTHNMRKGGYSESFRDLPNISACCADEKKALFALTNGTLWKCVGQNRETYVCPQHVIRAGRKNVKVRFSYAMSAYFGYDWSQGSKAATSERGSDISLNAVKLDRKLLFAEIPFAIPGADDGASPVDESTAYSTADNNVRTDCVLQYKASKNGKDYHANWVGTGEPIAFNHRSGKKYCAHVVFADGHAEKLTMPKGGELNSVVLTALLCSGVDVSYDGSGYSLVTNGDK